MQGIVKKWIVDRGFGFITPAAGGADLFVHVSALGGLPELVTGQRVEFEEEHDERRGKYKAINVRVLAGQAEHVR
jgi:CspA family cold shock protein